MHTSRLPLAVLLACLAPGCGNVSSFDYTQAPEGPSSLNPTKPPSQPPPTGEKWVQAVAEDGCERSTFQYTLVDEMCGATDDPGYFAALRAPMFRDGARIQDHLFAVDGTLLWVLDLEGGFSGRETLVPGLGQPLAVAAWEHTLLVASGEEGLLLLDVTDPTAPVVVHRLALPGPALALHREGNTLYVALGKEGLALVKLTPRGPFLERVIPLEGDDAFAVGVRVRGGFAYVAACSGLAILSLREKRQIAHAWPSQATNNGTTAPAKGVELIEDVAFVAAGRLGAVAIDIRDPQNPSALGACARPDEPLYYVSGVRAQGTTLFLAAGEWGVDRIAGRTPELFCTSFSPFATFPSSTPPSACGQPPWEVIPWSVAIPPPPPPARDPIQVLPWGNLVYAFGDARRLGTRAINAHAASSLALEHRYEEPRRAIDVAAHQDRLLVLGDGGGFFQEDPEALLLKTGELPAEYRAATTGRWLDDGRWVLAVDQQIHVEGGATMTADFPVIQSSLATRGTRVAVGNRTGVRWLDADTGEQGSSTFLFKEARTPPAIAFAGDNFLFAAPEWTEAAQMSGSSGKGSFETLPAHGVFSSLQIEDPHAWYQGLPRRFLLPAGDGYWEIAALGFHAGVKQIRGEGAPLGLPGADYTAAAYAQGRGYLVGLQRATYTSVLVTLEESDDGPRLLEVRSFLGQASGVATTGPRVYVADASVGVRVFERGDSGTIPLGVVALEEAP